MCCFWACFLHLAAKKISRTEHQLSPSSSKLSAPKSRRCMHFCSLARESRASHSNLWLPLACQGSIGTAAPANLKRWIGLRVTAEICSVHLKPPRPDTGRDSARVTPMNCLWWCGLGDCSLSYSHGLPQGTPHLLSARPEKNLWVALAWKRDNHHETPRTLSMTRRPSMERRDLEGLP